MGIGVGTASGEARRFARSCQRQRARARAKVDDRSSATSDRASSVRGIEANRDASAGGKKPSTPPLVHDATVQWRLAARKDACLFVQL
jgi:hypothetical protein